MQFHGNFGPHYHWRNLVQNKRNNWNDTKVYSGDFHPILISAQPVLEGIAHGSPKGEKSHCITFIHLGFRVLISKYISNRELPVAWILNSEHPKFECSLLFRLNFDFCVTPFSYKFYFYFYFFSLAGFVIANPNLCSVRAWGQLHEVCKLNITLNLCNYCIQFTSFYHSFCGIPFNSAGIWHNGC